MKAIVYRKYGSTENLKLEDIEKPIPNSNEVLIKVHAAAVNSWDWDLVKGKPFLTRLAGGGIFNPKKPILGCDVSGVVESVGNDVTDFKIGDSVFGDISGCGWGAFAEYVCARADLLAEKPNELSFEQAAAIPQAGVLALQALRHAGEINSGTRILINGAGGGVGTFGLQLAKIREAKVTCVDRSDKLDMLNSLGADKVIDYTKQDFTELDDKYNLIIDNVASRSIKQYERVLLPGGKLIVVGGGTGSIIKIALLGSILPGSGKRMKLLLHKPNREDLTTLSRLAVDGKIMPIIDKVFPLNQTGAAIKNLGYGNVEGKIIVNMNASN